MEIRDYDDLYYVGDYLRDLLRAQILFPLLSLSNCAIERVSRNRENLEGEIWIEFVTASGRRYTLRFKVGRGVIGEFKLNLGG